MRVRIALAAGLALLAAAIAAVLSGSPVVRIGDNAVSAQSLLAVTASSGANACQSQEVLPAGTSAIRLGLLSTGGPQVYVRALAGARSFTTGVVGSGWGGASVTVPIRTVSHTTPNARICFELGPSKERVSLRGSRTAPRVAARGGDGSVLPGRLRIEYLRTGSSSWWSLARTVARRMGLGHAPSGGWIALLVALMMGAGLTVACWLAIKELG